MTTQRWRLDRLHDSMTFPNNANATRSLRQYDRGAAPAHRRLLSPTHPSSSYAACFLSLCAPPQGRIKIVAQPVSHQIRRHNDQC